MLKKYFLLPVIISCCSLLLQAQDNAEHHFYTVGLFYDQDYTLQQAGFKKLNEDRNYTMGFGLSYSTDKMNKWIIYTPQNWLIKKIKPRGSDEIIPYYNLMLANGTFTPDSLPAAYPILNDRPYASLTYLQTNAHYLNTHTNKMYSISISGGILGSNISKEVQTYIHTHMNDNDTHDPRTPRGWGNQISRGGAPTALIEYQEDYLLTTRPIENSKTQRCGGEWKTAWNVSAGWYNKLAGEISYRFGLLDTRKWTYITNPLGTSNMFTFNGDSKSNTAAKTEIYLFSTLRANLIGYNVLLSGQSGDDPVLIPNSDVRHGVLDGSAGICISPVIKQSLNIELKGKFNFRSPEFEMQGRPPRWHYWGGIELMISVFN